jgi:hypothetical protein
LGWIDQALQRIGKKRKITIFTRHYQMPGLLAQNNDLIATLPTKVATMQAVNPQLVMLDPPFYIPEFELKMAWSPLLHPNAGHQWLRRLIMYSVERMEEDIVMTEIPACEYAAAGVDPSDLI